MTAGTEEEPVAPPSIDNIQQRLEQLLSKRHLADDAFLLQHMNAQMYIPLTVLAAHYKLCGVEDPHMLHTVKAAAQRSDKVAVNEDGTMVRPLLKPRRNTLILHDLCDGYPEEDLRALFTSSPESEAFVGLTPDVNNTAFAKFKTDEAAQNVALWLRSQKFQGSEIKCAVKSEHFVRSFFPVSPGPNMQASPYPAWAYPAWMGSNTAWSDASYPADPKASAKGDGKKGKGSGRRKRTSTTSSVTDTGLSPAVAPQESPSPALSTVSDFTSPGYSHAYRQLSRQHIIDVCNKMDLSKIEKPESFELAEKNEKAFLFRATPCKDWAPLPTPMQTFASQPSIDHQEQGAGGGQQRKTSWGPKASKRNSRSQSDDEAGGNRAGGDSSWWAARDRSNSKPGSYWVKKEDGEREDHSATQMKSSWSEKSQRWVEKAKQGQETNQDSSDATAEAVETTKETASLTWAEKLRASTSDK